MYVDVGATRPDRGRGLQLPDPLQRFLVRQSAHHLERWQTGGHFRHRFHSQPGLHLQQHRRGAPVDLIIPGETATAAAFSPDQLKVFILTNTGNMYVYSTVDALTSVPIATSVTDVKFSADGSFAYVAGTPPPNPVSGYRHLRHSPPASVLQSDP